MTQTARLGRAAAPFRVHRIRPARGYLHGLRQPVLIADVSVDLAARDGALIERVEALLDPHLPPAEPGRGGAGELAAEAGVAGLQKLAELAARIEDAAGGLVAERALILLSSGAGARERAGRLALPTVSAPLGVEVFKWLVGVVRLAEAGDPDLASGIAAELETTLDRLQARAPLGLNSRSLIRAAHARDIPTIPLPGGVVQFGYGAGARLFRSTMTDATSAIGAHLSRDKRYANRILAMAGLPVAEQRPVGSLEEAERVAAELGYPVVLKPADLDQGVGVFAGIESVEELRHAHAGAARASSAIVLERFVPGTDYRVNMLDGEVETVVARIPASVTGDGAATIRQLVDRENENPRRGTKRFSQLKIITIDADMERYLARSGLTPDSVPERGRTVRLRGNANVSTGGVTEGATEAIHPANAELCRRVARLLNLDIAGIDLICPDISRPIAETGGVVCEVNAQPQVGITFPWYFETIVERYCTAPGMRLGLWLSDAGGTAPEGALAREDLLPALLDRERASAVWSHDGADIGEAGLPVDRLHALAVGPWQGEARRLAGAARLLSEHLRGPVLIAADHPHGEAVAGAVRGAVGADRVERLADHGAVAARLRELLTTG
jgi:cyanophycin synthetase